MKKRVIFILAFVMILSVVIHTNTFVFAYNELEAKNISVNLPSFKVTINGIEINNTYSKYPLITYKNITYFPMTYSGCRYLGLETIWNQSSGLEINKTNITYPYSEYISNARNSNISYASIPTFDIKINGRTIENRKEEYPLLIFKNVTYFPLTWAYGVDEFGWDYNYDNLKGLSIKSKNPTPNIMELPDYLQGGQFILSDEHIYYAGNKGAVYKAPINNLQGNKKIYQTPENNMYYPEGTYAFVYFGFKEGQCYFTYHVGGATMGSTYEVKINADDTVSKPVSVGIGVAPSPQSENGYVLDWSSENHNGFVSRGYKAPRYETELYDYVIAYRENVSEDLSRIYKLNKAKNKLTLISDLPTGSLKYRDGKIYFLSNDYKLYGFSVNEDIVKLINDGPIFNLNDLAYDVLNDNIYYINMEDGKVYKTGDSKALNFAENGSSVTLEGNYAVIRFDSTIPNSYRTIIYDKKGKEVLKTPKSMQILSIDSGKLAYYDEELKKVFIIKLQ